MEKKFKKMYEIMGILGEALGLAGALYFIIKNQTLQNNFYILFIVLFVFLCGVRIAKNMLNKGKIKSIKPINGAIAKGHLSMMFGVSMLVVAFMYTSAQPFLDTIMITLIIIAFMTFMMFFIMKTYTRLQKVVEESEKK